LSATRSKAAASRFFRYARNSTGMKPTCVYTDKLASYRKAIRKVCGRKVIHQTSQYFNVRIEQDYRGIKRRDGSTLGFKDFACAACFCAAVDETRQLFRTRTTMKETISLAEYRRHFPPSVTAFQQIFASCPFAAAKRKSRIAA